MPRRDFDSTMPEVPKVDPFITNDEIAEAMSHGSSFASGKARIYDYFTQPHTPKEYADFLKKEYGIGGRSPALSSATHSSEDHDGKGLHYKKRGCPEIHLSWPQVVKQIQELIRLDRYLTPAEKAELEAIREMHDEPAVVPDERILEATDLGIAEPAIDIQTEREDRPYLVVAYHHFENGFDAKLDYQTLAEAERAAQGYVDGTMEADGFQYDGAAVYDQQSKQYLRIYLLDENGCHPHCGAQYYKQELHIS